jgi:hypothetical protein
MRLEGHPEYIQALLDRETVARCRRAVEGWKAGRLELQVPAYGLSWTPESALSLVHELQDLFAAYNRVLWEQFLYCRACGGQCCVNEASHVGPFDGVAIALLETSLPDLPPNLPTTDRACIYLAGRACCLPVEWRTIKCWSFFCLGGLWDPAAPLGKPYSDLTAALKAVVQTHLRRSECLALRTYEEARGDPLVDHLHDPADFAAALDDALWEVLVGPLHARYPLLDEREPDAPTADADTAEDQVLAFVAEAMEQVLLDPPSVPEGLPLTAAQLLEDLETLEWIAVGRPTHRARLLREMGARYAGVPGPVDGEGPSVWYQMRTHLDELL